ncbi:MAG: hypothetical protein JWR60_348 [Polaromonas sp.]|nr:hypothetical protein [Polaromonas sp.]
MAAGKDGRFPLQNDVSGLIAPDIASFLLIGKESYAAGRQRDAEVAFLMACRVANQLKGADSVEVADAKYQLGWLYARLGLEAGAGSAAGNQGELLQRARALYADSLKAYVAQYGEAHEKSRFAAEGLAAVRQPQTLAQAGTVAAEPVPAPKAAPAPALPAPAQEAAARPEVPAAGSPRSSQALPAPRPPPRRPELAKAAPPAPATAAARPGPSFNCARARSAPEVMICSDAELSRLDRELGRLYAQAKAATSNRAAFRRQQEHEWQMRETICRDRACLLRWYAQRKNQLQADISKARGERGRATASR